MPRIARLCLLFAGLLILNAIVPGEARTRHTSPTAPAQRPLAIGLISGGIQGTAAHLAADMAAVLDAPDLRILPILGDGSEQNLRDLLTLNNVDIAMVQTDVLETVRKDPQWDKLSKRLQFIAKLHNEEFHLLVRGHVNRVADLAGLKVNVDLPDSGTATTARIIFAALGLRVEMTHYDQSMALDKLRSGEISALAYVAGKPAPLFQRVRPEDDLHFLSIGHPPELVGSYLPTRLTKADYPNLIVGGDEVKTLAVGSALVALNPRQKAQALKIERFTTHFFEQFASFRQAGRHPKWREVSLSAQLPDWPRMQAASDWLIANQDRLKAYADAIARQAAKAEANNAAKAETPPAGSEAAAGSGQNAQTSGVPASTAATSKPEAGKPDATKAEAGKPETAKLEPAKPATPTAPQSDAKGNEQNRPQIPEAAAAQSPKAEGSPAAEAKHEEKPVAGEHGQEPRTEASAPKPPVEAAPNAPAGDKKPDAAAAGKPAEHGNAPAPAENPGGKAADKATDSKASDKPADGKPIDKPADGKGTDKPVDTKTTDKPADSKGTDKPAGEGKAADKPANDKPADTPADKPAEHAAEPKPTQAPAPDAGAEPASVDDTGTVRN